jgi:uncharacterized protein YkwD
MRSVPPAPPSSNGNKSHVGAIVAIFLSLAVVAIIGIFVLTNMSVFTSFFNLGNTVTTVPITSSTSEANLTIGYPSDYSTLVNYALQQINSNRADFNVSAVSLSPILSGQEHAYSMYENGYFSHWDVQGYKPYMRYSLLNGTGAVEENVAYESTCSYCATFTNAGAVEGAIHTLESDMIYNDSACCQNGHLLNIINPYHNRVSIGIMYDSTHVYFVEDFENYYINVTAPIFNASSGDVTLRGNDTGGALSLNPNSVIINYDPTPMPLNASVLNSQYQVPYNEGTFIGGVIPCSYICTTKFDSPNSLTIQPSTWDVTGDSINIVFSLTQFIARDGSGVYTIYLTQNTFASNPNDTETLTSFSIFVQQA